MSTNPLSIIELMEKEYDISKPEGDSTSGGERCFNDLFMIDQDNNVNIQDIILMINYILEESIPDIYQFIASDINEDGVINVLDIVLIVDIIFEE